MLVFGDHVRVRDPRVVIAELRGMLAGARDHAALVSAFIEASELAQGIADAESEAFGVDGDAAATDEAMQLLLALAGAVAGSWMNGVIHVPDVSFASPLPDVVRMKRAEGYAYYAVYPEAYLVAARGSRADEVIGIRSIGGGLGSLVAWIARTRPARTVRPRGNPFRRELAVEPAWIDAWQRAKRIAIADEGPGMSGSSFGAVLDLLERAGVPLERVECYPSHRGELGPAASEPHRERWRRVRRHVTTVDDLLVDSGVLARSIANVVGKLVEPLRDLSGGAWRSLHGTWPPSVTYQERRKFLATTRDGTWLAKFVGLGRAGEHAYGRARTLAAAGFSPEPVGLCHGFSIERWHATSSIPRDRLVARVGEYLAFRAREFPAEQGASLAQLCEMVNRNGELALGVRPELLAPDLRARPIEIDGRLHAWEWLAVGDRILKTDAVDHHAAHDLVGCQDVTWDVAGAEVELSLTPDELARVIEMVETTTRVDRDLLAFMRVAYAAFQLGRHAQAIDAVDAAEAQRLRVATERYAAQLRMSLAAYR